MTVQGREAWEIAFDEWCPLEITDPAKAPKSVHVKGCWQTGFQAGYDAGRSAMREEAAKHVEKSDGYETIKEISAAIRALE